MAPTLTPAFVATWSANYTVPALEVDLFTNVGPAAKQRGFFKRDELLKVARWKAGGRIVGRVDSSNSDWEIKEITKAALASPQGLQHRILALLNYINIRAATAALAVVNPRRDTVMDVRALGAIERLTQLGDITVPLAAYGHPRLPAYIEYRDLCAATAKRLGCSLRDLDRALWAWHAAGMP